MHTFPVTTDKKNVEKLLIFLRALSYELWEKNNSNETQYVK